MSWNPDFVRVSLIVFVDASEKAFAAVAYLRFKNDGRVEVAQVMAKAKAAPVKKLSVSRLELQAAVLGTRLALTVKKSHSINIDETIFLSDSSTVLSWINSTKFKFPSVVEILDSSLPRQWFHIRTMENVADDATKWSNRTIGDSNSRWFVGPNFLQSPMECWPIQPGKSVAAQDNLENVDSIKNLFHNKKKIISFNIYEELKPRFRANWTSSVRVMAYILRFINIIRKKIVDKELFITPFEYQQAQNWMFRKIQMDSFPADFLSTNGKVKLSSSLLSLSPFLDEENTIRMSSRAQKAMISYAARNPAILPKSNALVDLLIEHHHVKNYHMGTASTISEILSTNGKVKLSSSLLSLSPFLDEENTIRMSSRAQKAMISYAARNPAILPKSHALVDLLIEHHHVKNYHMGTASTISEIRENAWVINIRSAVERVRSRCCMCKRLKAKPITPIMGQLPEARLSFHLRPFTHVELDCFGPLLVKFGRGTVKRYGMIFTCLTFRAVQIELLNNISLDQCTMALRRFVINRVVTRYLYSDNGLNFIGTKNQLDKDIKAMESALSESAAKYEGICWRFIPAYSPWMGGAWERLIQSIKNSVEFVLKAVILREDVFRNALMEAQGQINRRPLTHIPVDPEDPRPLTPNSMFFADEEKNTTAPGIFSERDINSKLYSRRSQHLMSEIIKRWYSEYLPVIIRRSKWHHNIKSVEVGNVFVLIEPNEIRHAWRLGRIVKVYPGPDGVVRTADIKVSNGTIKLKRSVGRLAVLDLESSH